MKYSDLDTLMKETDPEVIDSLLLMQMKETMEENIPLKTARLRDTDKRSFTTELKEIDRQRKREYVKNGKSSKFFALKEKFEELYSKAARGYLKKNVDSLLKTRPGRPTTP